MQLLEQRLGQTPYSMAPRDVRVAPLPPALRLNMYRDAARLPLSHRYIDHDLSWEGMCNFKLQV